MKANVGLSLLLFASCCHAHIIRQSSVLTRTDLNTFPDDFIFGTATAAYQVEGAWNLDGKGENIWDHLTHNSPHLIKDQSNGDVAADSYHNYKRDVEMMRELGIDMYRFSLSWTRILPEGLPHRVNQAGIDFYNNFINEMMAYNITPMVTLYHWDLPQKLQDLGGFANPLIAGWFEDYARVAYTHFGDRVKHWITFNEPREICQDGYGSNSKAPVVNNAAIGTYICAKNLVMAHARAYHAYDDDFRPTQGGECGITLSVAAYTPLTDSEADAFAAELTQQAMMGIYGEPIFGAEGGMPKDLAAIVADKSAQQGFRRSRLPEFTDAEREYARGTSDFFGVNHYSGAMVAAAQYGNINIPSVYTDIEVSFYIPPDWPQAASSWLFLAPDSIFQALDYLNQKYNGPKFYITENGWSTLPEGSLSDDDRIAYYRAAWESVLKSINSGIDLRGYMAWSLMDNFEWMQGYTERFGLYHVNFDDPMRTRTARKSALVYKHLIKHRVIDYQYEPTDLTITIDE